MMAHEELFDFLFPDKARSHTSNTHVAEGIF